MQLALDRSFLRSHSPMRRTIPMLVLGSFVFLFIGLQAARGQAMPASDGAATIHAVATAAVPSPLAHVAATARPAEPAAPRQTAPAEASPEQPGAAHRDGIQIHGHWVIEVRNPDGTVTARREFENSLQPFGGAFIAALLAGNNASGGLAIFLNYANQANTGSLEVGPCDAFGCVILSPVGNAGYTSQFGAACRIGTSDPSPNCAQSLSITAPTLTNNATYTGMAQIVMSGSVTATQGNGGPSCWVIGVGEASRIEDSELLGEGLTMVPD